MHVPTNLTMLAGADVGDPVLSRALVLSKASEACHTTVVGRNAPWAATLTPAGHTVASSSDWVELGRLVMGYRFVVIKLDDVGIEVQNPFGLDRLHLEFDFLFPLVLIAGQVGLEYMSTLR